MATTTVTQRGPPHGHACRAGPCHCEKCDISSSGPPHPPPSQLHPVRQSSQVRTWRLHSVSPRSLHTLARAVYEALAKRQLHLESKHFHSWVWGGGGWANWHTQRVLGEFDTTLNPTVTSGMADDLRSPLRYSGAILVYSWVHIHSSRTVDSVPWTYYSQLSPCPSSPVSNIIHVLAICSVSTRGPLAALAEALGS